MVTMPPAQIRPGQPGNEAAFQAAYIAAGGAARLGDALGEVYQDGPGWVQHFDGGPTGEPAVLCALPGRPAVAVAGSVWNELGAVGGGALNGGTAGAGCPVDPSEQCPFIGADSDVVELAGGRWGRTKRGRLVRRASGRWGWQPEIDFDSNASRDRDAWTAHADKMDLRLRIAARIPLVADGLRITGSGRARMLAALAHAGMADIARTLAKPYGIDPGDVAWQETDEPEGDNNSRFAAYQASIAGVDGRQAMRACLWLALPDEHATELLSVVDLRIDFDAIRPGLIPTAPAYIPAELRVTTSDLIDFFAQAWHVATMVLPLAATESPLDVPPAGAPRLELYIQNERPEMSGGDRTLRTLDMADLSVFGPTRRSQIRDLGVAVTTPLGLPEQEIASLVKRAMIRMADHFGFTAADGSRL